MKFTQTMTDADYKKGIAEFYRRTTISKVAGAVGVFFIVLGVVGTLDRDSGFNAPLYFLIGALLVMFTSIQAFFLMRIIRKSKSYGLPVEVEIGPDNIIFTSPGASSTVGYDRFIKYFPGRSVLLLYLNNYTPILLKMQDLREAGALELLCGRLEAAGVPRK